MNGRKLILIILLLVFPFLTGKTFFNIKTIDAETISATIKIVICGNNIKEEGEDCDTNDLNNKTCQNFGYIQGTLSCYPSCDFNFNNCSRGGNVNTNTTNYRAVPETKIILTGMAYPRSNMVLLKDGQIALKTIAGDDGIFNMELSGLSSGTYIFSVYGEDNKGITSSPFVFPIKITQGASTTISGVFIPPTISTDKEEVKQGDYIAIFGQAPPQSDVTIVVSSDNQIVNKIKADKNGIYLYNFNTSLLEKGDHYAKSIITLNQESVVSGKSVKFTVGDTDISSSSQSYYPGDLNYDNKINLVDFSIAAYWYKKNLSESFAVIEKKALNGDGKIDLVDFSIMAFYWKG